MRIRYIIFQTNVEVKRYANISTDVSSTKLCVYSNRKYILNGTLQCKKNEGIQIIQYGRKPGCQHSKECTEVLNKKI